MHATNKYYSQTILASTILMVTLVTGCNSDNDDEATTVPVINASNPIDFAIDVAINQQITVTFSEAMKQATINDASFTLTDPNQTAVLGVVSYNETSNTAVFAPSSDFSHNTMYKASITTEVTSAAGIALDSDFSWVFTTSAQPDLTAPTVEIGRAHV